MADSANVSLIEAGVIHYSVIKGDTFAPPPVSFRRRESETDPWQDEDFSGAALRMQVRNDKGRIMADISDGDGITVNANALQYIIDADEMEEWTAGIYHYDVEKTISGIRKTKQRGTITIVDETTKAT